ncbi:MULTISPECIES: hypothetical protein [Acinetobacter]|uniref:hypothetical protein n=1 Tax=Acinetobacter TaxID=469 RepID=UPI00143FF72A|nr:MULTISPECIES: hypothetical protein [Acinetobacter]MCP0917395.1 hypothetical protein [Acinetobacter indicus]MCP0920508.1 hypothetical protein [Acinetobacter indicus]MCP0923175.1 hypothetical protein [Acinetobacter indicus]MDM1292613.1 hypothetical protein [Acinetobacter indicus]MDM1322627.1 hypothetical protein [Acinetobacter indicus]
MFEKTLEIIFALTGALWLSISLITSFKSYAYVKKNLGSISELLFGNPKYFKKLDLTNFFLIETTTAIIAAARFRELKILKRDTVFSKGLFPLAPNLNDKNLNLLLKKHGQWYNSVVKNIIISAFCLLLLGTILLILK